MNHLGDSDELRRIVHGDFSRVGLRHVRSVGQRKLEGDRSAEDAVFRRVIDEPARIFRIDQNAPGCRMPHNHQGDAVDILRIDIVDLRLNPHKLAAGGADRQVRRGGRRIRGHRQVARLIGQDERFVAVGLKQFDADIRHGEGAASVSAAQRHAGNEHPVSGFIGIDGVVVVADDFFVGDGAAHAGQGLTAGTDRVGDVGLVDEILPVGGKGCAAGNGEVVGTGVQLVGAVAAQPDFRVAVAVAAQRVQIGERLHGVVGQRVGSGRLRSQQQLHRALIAGFQTQGAVRGLQRDRDRAVVFGGDREHDRPRLQQAEGVCALRNVADVEAERGNRHVADGKQVVGAEHQDLQVDSVGDDGGFGDKLENPAPFIRNGQRRLRKPAGHVQRELESVGNDVVLSVQGDGNLDGRV